MFKLQSIRAKLTTLAVLALSMVALTAIAGWWASEQLSAAARANLTSASAIKHQKEADMMHDAIRSDVLAGLLAQAIQDNAAVRTAKQDLTEHVAEFNTALSELQNLPLSDSIEGAVTKTLPALQSYAKAADQILNDALAGRAPDASARGGFDAAFKTLEDTMGVLGDQIEAEALASAANTERLAAWARYGMGAVVLVAAVLLLTISAFLAYGIVMPIREAVVVAEAVASGDLTASAKSSKASGETAQLLAALQKMANALQQTVSQVRTAVDNINTASAEIATGNQDLSARTERAASNLEETAASMEQITSIVRQSSDAAEQANQLATSAANIAERGGSVVGKVVTTMDAINTSSKKISDIIGVIDGIAFQTNILALNAAVEAARAGEQGRGFAVVAGEVRNLAQRSAEAAKQIKDLISGSVSQVEAGSQLVAEAGQTMNEIVTSVQRVRDTIVAITASASEQRDGIGQVNVAVSQLDQMTQQNAALVEQSAAAAESLRAQAERLATEVQVFRI